MSSISIVQEHNKFTYVVDTAESCVVNDTIYRIRGSKCQKTHRIGNDVVFMSGATMYLDDVGRKMHDLLDNEGHIIMNSLQDILRRDYPVLNDSEDARRYHLIGFVVMSIINGKTLLKALKQSYNHFEIIQREVLNRDTPLLSVDGFKNEFFHKTIMENEKEYFKRNGRYYILENILKSYRENYSEGVGGEIQMYTFDDRGVNLIHTEQLCETGLKYLDKGINVIEGNSYRIHINGYTPITAGNIGSQSVANANLAMIAASANSADVATVSATSFALKPGGAGYGSVYVSVNGNLRPQQDSASSCGTSDGRWSSVWAVNGTIQTSDMNKKNTIQDLDDRYLQFIKMIIPKSFKMNEGTSGRVHIGFIAQDIEAAMIECGISDMEFAGLIKAPIYSQKLRDEEGNELSEYDTASEITGYDYALRYDEFIPLLLDRIINQEERLCAIEKLMGI